MHGLLQLSQTHRQHLVQGTGAVAGCSIVLGDTYQRYMAIWVLPFFPMCFQDLWRSGAEPIHFYRCSWKLDPVSDATSRFWKLYTLGLLSGVELQVFEDFHGDWFQEGFSNFAMFLEGWSLWMVHLQVFEDFSQVSSCQTTRFKFLKVAWSLLSWNSKV